MSEERAHALLSASGAKRWMSCPPSARLEDKCPERSSDFAQEGTVAHTLGELKINCIMDPTIKDSPQWENVRSSKYYSSAMEAYMDAYAAMVMERLASAQEHCLDAKVYTEQRVHYDQWVPGGFGTSDVVILADGTMEIIDLKYGKGIAVSAHENPQLKLYALGAYSKFKLLYDMQQVTMTICQPRLDTVDSYTLSIEELLEWAEKEVKPKAELAIAGKGDFEAGEHCRFCRIKSTCRTRAEANLALAQYDFKPSNLLNDDEISDVLTRSKALQTWVKDVQQYALEQAVEHHKRWPGMKLVAGRSVRAYQDEDKVADILRAEGYSDQEIYSQNLLGLTAMEKRVGKAKLGKLLGSLIVKPQGKPTLVTITDKRQELNTAQSVANDFMNN